MVRRGMIACACGPTVSGVLEIAVVSPQSGMMSHPKKPDNRASANTPAVYAGTDCGLSMVKNLMSSRCIADGTKTTGFTSWPSSRN